MKKRIYFLLSLVMIVSFCGCGRGALLSEIQSKEDKAYQETVTALFDAIDRKDADALYGLFSPAVREQDEDLREQIDKLFSIYTGTTDEIGKEYGKSGSGHYDDGKRSESATAWFPVRSGDTYYWFYLNFMYENSFDENQIGITQLQFYTAGEWCIMEKIGDSVGLTVRAERTLEEEVRCINGDSYKYSSATEPLNLNEVKDFFKDSVSFDEFKARFGEPNAERIYVYYELPAENGKPRYLQLGTENNGDIYGAKIVDDYQYIGTVFDGEFDGSDIERIIVTLMRFFWGEE